MRSRLAEQELWGRWDMPAREGFAHSREEPGIPEEIHLYVPNQRKRQHLDICHPEGSKALFFFISASCPGWWGPLAASREAKRGQS